MADFGKVVENLKKRGYAVKEFATAKEAAEYLNGAIDGVSVGFGGSATLDVMGLYDMLSSHNTVYWHWKQGRSSILMALVIVWHLRCLDMRKFIMSLAKISWNRTLKRLLPAPEILRHLRERHSLEKRHLAL